MYVGYNHENSKLIKAYNGSEQGLQLANTRRMPLTSGPPVRLNFNSLFDKHYWAQYNGRGYGVPGAGRGATLSADYSF